MIKKIIIDNFMAHEHTELELGPGVTALTGPNNTGKSAIVEALRCVTTNPVPRHYIRHGAKEARVTVQLDDDTKVVWVRKKRSSGYELWQPGADEPAEYWKFGRKPPEDVLKALRLDLVELETGNEIDVHVGNQREPVFLLNQPASNAAAFFAASTESAHLLAMQNLLKRRTQDAKREERAIKTRMHEVHAELDELAMLPDIAAQVESARNLEAAALKFQTEIPALESALKNRKELSKTLAKRAGSATILKKADAPPKLNEVRTLRTVITHFDDLNHKLSAAQKSAASLSPLSPLPQTHDTASLANQCGQIKAAESELRKAEDFSKSLDTLSELPTTGNTAQLAHFMDEILALEYRRSRLAHWDDVLQKVAEPPRLEDHSALQGLVSGIHDLAAQRTSKNANLKGLETELKTVTDQLEKAIDRLGQCPTCGADLNTEAFIDRGSRHDA